jgi:transaldolase
MGASFRNIGQIKALAGCDRLTIAPKLLDELADDPSGLTRILSPYRPSGIESMTMDEVAFRWALNEDAMASEKLAEGIRNFHADHIKLVSLVAEQL